MDLLQAFSSDKVVPTKNDVIATIEEIKSRYDGGNATQAPRSAAISSSSRGIYHSFTIKH